jgi:hypothetical protein
VTQIRPWYEPLDRLPSRSIIPASTAMEGQFDTLVVEAPQSAPV